MIQVKVNIPGHREHPLNGHYSWPAVPSVGEFVSWKTDTFTVHNVSWQVGERGVEFVYLVLRGVSVTSPPEFTDELRGTH